MKALHVLRRLLVAILVTSLADRPHGFTIDSKSSRNLSKYSRSTESSQQHQLQMTVLSYNGKKKDFKAGSPLSKAVEQLGLKPTYSCRKGDCATCQIFLAGRATKPCVAKVPEAPKLKSLQEKGLEIRV